jgi:hypothetical protein
MLQTKPQKRRWHENEATRLIDDEELGATGKKWG